MLSLELVMLLATVSVASAIWVSDGLAYFQSRQSVYFLAHLCAGHHLQHERARHVPAQRAKACGPPCFGSCPRSRSVSRCSARSSRSGPICRSGAASAASSSLGATGVVLTRLVVFKSAESALLEARLIFVGAGPLARECMELAFRKFGFHQFSVVGCLPVDGEDSCVCDSYLLPMAESLLTMAQKYEASEIVVTVGERRGSAFPIEQLLECAGRGARDRRRHLFEREACQIRLDSLQPSYRNSRLTLRISIISSTPRLAA
ncbi:hypothetical protein LP420_40815 [Massilia sp. B-10]|nr:hypothetical protein LP420_40815 [Massilia sp. B-10]